MKEQSIKLGISIGDLNGIGGEVVLKTFEDARMLDFCTPVIFASAKTVSFLLKHFELDINFQGVKEASNVIEGTINVVNVWKDNPRINSYSRSIACAFNSSRPQTANVTILVACSRTFGA